MQLSKAAEDSRKEKLPCPLNNLIVDNPNDTLLKDPSGDMTDRDSLTSIHGVDI